MKRILLFLLVALFQNLTCSAQDTIVKMNGLKVICQVIEITDLDIIYRISNPSNDETIKKNLVSHIIYSNNDVELFQSKSIKQMTRILRLSKNPIVKTGFYFSLSPGHSHLIKRGTIGRSDFGGLDMRVGNKWYFGDTINSRHGLDMCWGKFGIYVNNAGDHLMASIINPGYSGIYRIRKNQAIETRINFGLAASSNVETLLGFNVDPGIFYRKKRFSIGFLYSFFYGNKFSISSWGVSDSGYSSGIVHTYSLSIGLKF